MPKEKSTNILDGRQPEDLIDLLFSDNHAPEQELEEIRMWLAENENMASSLESLRRKFIESHRYEENSEYSRRTWPKLAQRLGFDAAFPLETVRPGKDQPPLPKLIPLRKRAAFRVAAAVVPLLVLGGAILYLSRSTPVGPSPDGLTAQAVTLTGGQGAIGDNGHTEATLPDSSRIILTAGSTLTYADDFTENREVHIDGEAFFSVTRRDGKPFRVVSNSITVTVYGTEFEVIAYRDDPTAEVKLASGSVAVTAEGIGETRMTPGQHFVYDKAHQTVSLEEIGERELYRIRGVNLSLDGNTLDEAFGAMARYFGVEFRVPEGMDLSERASLSLEDDITLEEALALLKLISTTPFDYTIEDDTVKITRRR